VKISTFSKFSALNSQPVIQSFITGARKIGIDVVDHDMNADAALIWSVLWNGRMLGNQQVYHNFRQQNRPVFVLDVGTLRRNHTWKLAVNNLNNQGFYGHNDNLDHDRPTKLGIELKKPQTNNGKILVCLQHTRSHQIPSEHEFYQWINNTVKQIQLYCRRSIVIRPHPRCRFRSINCDFEHIIDLPNKIKGTYDSFDFAPELYHAVINYNSGPGIIAALSGVRPIVNSTSLAGPVGIDVANIEQHYDIDRSQWLISIAHTEYTLEELKLATWEKRLQNYLTR
jgi:hypothetical protein